MAEALVDVDLVTTIATVDAHNSRQQTAINNRLGAKLCLAVATTEVASWREWRRQRQRRCQQWIGIEVGGSGHQK